MRAPPTEWCGAARSSMPMPAHWHTPSAWLHAHVPLHASDMHALPGTALATAVTCLPECSPALAGAKCKQHERCPVARKHCVCRRRRRRTLLAVQQWPLRRSKRRRPCVQPLWHNAAAAAAAAAATRVLQRSISAPRLLPRRLMLLRHVGLPVGGYLLVQRALAFAQPSRTAHCCLLVNIVPPSRAVRPPPPPRAATPSPPPWHGVYSLLAAAGITIEQSGGTAATQIGHRAASPRSSACAVHASKQPSGGGREGAHTRAELAHPSSGRCGTPAASR